MTTFSILRSPGVLAVLALVLSANASVVHGQRDDQCSDILKFGVFDESYLNSDRVDYRYFQYALRMNKRQTDRFQITQMLSYLSPLESYSQQWAASGELRRLEAMQEASLEERFTRDSLQQFVRSANETLVAAWLGCISLGAGQPVLTSKMSSDRQSFSLEADSGVRDLPLSLFGEKSWKRQLVVVPESAIVCKRGFRRTQTRDSITCRRNSNYQDARITIRLLTKFGEQQPVAVLPGKADIDPPPMPNPKAPVPLSHELQLGSHNFQAFVYRPTVSLSGIPYANALVMASQDQTASMVTYRIPPWAATFRTRVISYQARCDGSHGDQINGWRVVFYVPGLSRTWAVESYWNNSHDQEVVIPLTDLPPTADRTLSIAVDPAGYRYCDHSALGSPQFEPALMPIDGGEVSLEVASIAAIDAGDKGCCRIRTYPPFKTPVECWDAWTRARCYATHSELLLPVDFFKDTACKEVPDCRKRSNASTGAAAPEMDTR